MSTRRLMRNIEQSDVYTARIFFTFEKFGNTEQSYEQFEPFIQKLPNMTISDLRETENCSLQHTTMILYKNGKPIADRDNMPWNDEWRDDYFRHYQQAYEEVCGKRDTPFVMHLGAVDIKDNEYILYAHPGYYETFPAIIVNKCAGYIQNVNIDDFIFEEPSMA